MAPRSLNLSFLRSRHTAASCSVKQLELSRRGFLQLSGVAMAGVASGPLNEFNRQNETFHLVAGNNRVALQIAGEERFVVDGKNFCGEPVVVLQHEDSEYALSLKGARFPGTSVPADLLMKVWRGMLGWRFSMWIAAADADCQGDLLEWLSGGRAAEFRLPRSGSVVLLPSAEISHRNADLLSFGRDWSLGISGRSAIQVEFEKRKITADHITLRLANSPEPVFVRNMPDRRTELSIGRYGRDWPFADLIPRIEGVELQPNRQVFDQLTLLTGEAQSGGSRYGALLEGDKSETLVLRSSPDVIASDGSVFRLPLARTRLARFPQTGESYFSAGIAGNGTQVRFGDVSYRISDSSEKPAVGGTGDGGEALSK